MDVAKAKYFVCWDCMKHVMYKAKKLQTLFDEVELASMHIGVMAVLDTEIGEVLFAVEESYSGEPIIMDKIMHVDSFMGFHPYKTVIEL